MTRAQDDGFDIDLGWRGRAQFVAILQDAAGDNAVEIDNLHLGTALAFPTFRALVCARCRIVGPEPARSRVRTRAIIAGSAAGFTQIWSSLRPRLLLAQSFAR